MAKQFVDDAIKNNPVVVFSKTYCPFCKMAKDALKSVGLQKYELYELDERGTVLSGTKPSVQTVLFRGVPLYFLFPTCSTCSRLCFSPCSSSSLLLGSSYTALVSYL